MSEYRKIIEEFYDDMMAFAVSLHRNIDDARDNVQGVVLKFMEKEGDYKECDLHRLLLTSVRNSFINSYRIKKTRTFVELDACRDRTDSQTDIEIMMKDILNAMMDLRPELQSIIQMRIDGYKYEEISEETGVVMGTTKARLFKARCLLKKNLGIDGKKKNH